MFPPRKSSPLQKTHIERYCRQIILPEVGSEGQSKIQNSKILIIGAGGLGSPCLMYLSGAGVGEIGIVDGDIVDKSNLHRQIIHSFNNKGINKAKSAEMFINSLNPLVKVNTYEFQLTNKNAIDICSKYDLVVDCCDNPATRYLISDVCVILNKPMVSGAAIKWEGHVTVYVSDSINKLPCYRCLYPISSPVSSVCPCSEAGVIGTVPGVIGTLQANEVIKILIGGNQKILAKKCLFYDAYEMKFKIWNTRGNREECITCGKNPLININNIDSYDYEDFTNPILCRIEKKVILPKDNSIKWNELLKMIKEKDKSEFYLIDVRPKEQYNMFNLIINEEYKFVNYPWNEFKDNFEQIKLNLDKDKRIFVICRSGNNSTHAIQFLIENGYLLAFNVENGLHGYIQEIDSANIPFY